MIRVLSVASECVPLVKTGGLADVVGALPAALAGQGVDMRVLLPGYRPVWPQVEAGEAVFEDRLFGGTVRLRPARLARPAGAAGAAGGAAGLDLLVIEAPHLYDRAGGPYLDPAGRDWPDNAERFAALSLVAARLAAAGAGDWHPQLLHCHDWQAGFAPVYLRDAGLAERVKSVLTIHNVAFHGLAPRDRRAALHLPAWADHSEGLEFWGRLSSLKAGIVFADRVTTVSPSYAAELLTPEFGMGMEGILRSRAADLVGILNGIDTEIWNPETDPGIVPFRTPAQKAANRAALEAEFALPAGAGPLAVVVSRLTAQKGLDVLAEALGGFLDRGGRLALLGAGDAALEARWRALARADHRVAVHIGYDEAMSHRLIAGGDAILVPSRFEPCGLTQLYGLRYGAVPVVARTGGLADTVIDANEAALRVGVATGVQFAPVSADAIHRALMRLCDLHADRRRWTRMIRNAMRQPVGWDIPAASHAQLYRDLIRTDRC